MSAALSLCVITRDAAATARGLPRVGVRSRTRCIVVDSGSVDDTVEIARRRGARVIEQPWLGYGAQKNFAVAQASHDWVLCLDADERVTPELAASIRRAIAAPGAARRVRDGPAQPLSRPLAAPRRRLSRLERPAVRPPPRALDATIPCTSTWSPMAPWRGSTATCCTSRRNRSTPTSPSRTATRRCRRRRCTRRGERAGAARLVAVAAAALRALLRLPAGLSRRRGGLRAHRHRLPQQLHEVREAAGLATRGAATGEQARTGDRRGGIHRHARRRRGCSTPAPRSTGVDNFDPYYDVALKQARLATLAGRAGFRFERTRPRGRRAARRGCFATARSRTSCIWPRSPACAIR